MEETIPLSVSNYNSKAPEELFSMRPKDFSKVQQ